MNVVIKGRELIVNGAIVATGSLDELKPKYLEYRYGGKAAPVMTDRKALDMSRAELRALRNGKWQVFHPDFIHPQWGHSLYMGTEERCRKIMGLAPSAKSQALAAEHIAAAREVLSTKCAIVLNPKLGEVFSEEELAAMGKTGEERWFDEDVLDHDVPWD